MTHLDHESKPVSANPAPPKTGADGAKPNLSLTRKILFVIAYLCLVPVTLMALALTAVTSFAGFTRAYFGAWPGKGKTPTKPSVTDHGDGKRWVQ